MLLSGGALLVGDLASPGPPRGREQAEAAAQEFCRTIQTKILELPDHVEVFPTHVAGSLCGGNIGSRLSTTVGYERRTNQILSTVSSKGEFVEQCLRLDNLPAVPPYWKRMRRQNLAGAAPLGVLREPPALAARTRSRAWCKAAVVLDTRPPEAFGGGHIPRALNVGRARPPHLGRDRPRRGRGRRVGAGFSGGPLARDVGPAPDRLRLPVGWLAGGMMAWRTAALDLERLPQITVHELRRRLDAGDVDLLDVRQPAEWADGHVEGATFITGGELPRRLDDVPVPGGPGRRLRIRLPVLGVGEPARRPHRPRGRQRPRRDDRVEGRRLPGRLRAEAAGGVIGGRPGHPDPDSIHPRGEAAALVGHAGPVASAITPSATPASSATARPVQRRELDESAGDGGGWAVRRRIPARSATTVGGPAAVRDRQADPGR